MQNIPTDLLRTLVAVVDLRSFTKAAQSLGVTQPAVSAQIKRLQAMLGYELFDKSAPGVTLTRRGDIVVDQARRLLSVNDEILQVTGGGAQQTLRVGIPGDYSGSRIPATLARFRLRWPNVGFIVCSGMPDVLFRDLQRGDLDIVLAVTETEREPPMKPRHFWLRQAVWVRHDSTRIEPEGPVPLISYAEECACQRIAVSALNKAGRDAVFVFTSASLVSLAAAVKAGFGVMVMPRGRALRNDLYVWYDAPLPDLPQLFCGIYVRDSGSTPAADELADYFEADLRSDPPEEAFLQRQAAVTPIRA